MPCNVKPSLLHLPFPLPWRDLLGPPQVGTGKLGIAVSSSSQPHRGVFLRRAGITLTFQQENLSDALGGVIWECGRALIHVLDALWGHGHKRCLVPQKGCNGGRPPVRLLELGSGTGVVGIAAAVLMTILLRRCPAQDRCRCGTARPQRGPGVEATLTDIPALLPLARKNVGIACQQLVCTTEGPPPLHAVKPRGGCTPRPFGDCHQGRLHPGVPFDGAMGANTATLPTFKVRPLFWGKDNTTTQMDCTNGHWDIVVCSDCLYDANAYPKLVGTLRRVTNPGTMVMFACKRRDLGCEWVFWKTLQNHGFGICGRTGPIGNTFVLVGMLL